MPEIWKNIPSAPGYQASNKGRIRSVDRTIETKQGPKRRKGVVLAASEAPSGHLHVSLGRACKRTVHSVISETFIRPPEQGDEIRHLDGDPKNNSLKNLEIGDRSKNNRDRTCHGSNRLTRDQVSAARSRYATGETGTSLAAEFSVSKSLMYAILQGKIYV